MESIEQEVFYVTRSQVNHLFEVDPDDWPTCLRDWAGTPDDDENYLSLTDMEDSLEDEFPGKGRDLLHNYKTVSYLKDCWKIDDCGLKFHKFKTLGAVRLNEGKKSMRLKKAELQSQSPGVALVKHCR